MMRQESRAMLEHLWHRRLACRYGGTAETAVPQ
jgi:hypothetical protein